MKFSVINPKIWTVRLNFKAILAPLYFVQGLFTEIQRSNAQVAAAGIESSEKGK